MPSTCRAGPAGAVQREPAPPSSPEFELLESKLHPPWSRPGLVPRVSLLDRLLASEAPIVAVVAPPGYGKTTLLAQWSARSERRSAWVSLDQRDNDDPGVLLSYLAGALDRLEPIHPRFLQLLRSPAIVDLAGVLRRFVVAVAAMREPFMLVIDHVEVVQDQRCCDVIAELALNLPFGSQLALASRTEPPIPMARLRAKGLVLDLGLADLAMDRGEARDLVAASDVVLNDADLDDLVQRTEGWPVGLYLATLAGADGRDVQAGLAFAGDDWLMADYLRSEVLARLSPAATAFLTRTSVLDRLCGPLCDAVLGKEGSQHVLDSLETSILLLVPLDRRREWYRCHHLLRDLLRAELARSEAELIPRLHDRAAAWFEANGRIDLAIEHAQAAGDADRAARLVARIAQRTYAAGRVGTALGWLEWFDTHGLIAGYPHVAALGGLGEAMVGRSSEAERWADAAASGSFDGPLPDGSPIESWIALLEACLCRRGVARMRADAELARDRLAPGSPWGGPALVYVALSHVLDGDHDAADPILAQGIDICLRDGLMATAAPALAERAVVAIERGDWGAAEVFAREAVAIVGDAHLDGYLVATIVHAVAARSAAHRGDLTQAEEHVARASRLRPLCTFAFPVSAQFLLQLAHAYVELPDPAGARAVLRQVRDILQVRPDVGIVPALADELEHRVSAMRRGTVGPSSLTAAELRLLPLLATHLSNRDIGERLFVSQNTVKSHAVSIYRKLGVSSRGEAIEHAEAIGLLGP